MSQFPKLDEAQQRLHAKQDEMQRIFEEAGPERDMTKVKGFDSSEAVVDHIGKLNDEMAEIGVEIEKLKKVKAAADLVDRLGESGDDRKPADDAPKSTESLGDLFLDSPAYKGYHGGGIGPSATLDVDLKTTFSTSAGWSPETTRGPRVVLDAQRPVQVSDLPMRTTTTQSSVTYMEETTFTNAAAETAEAAAKPEATLEFTEQTSPVRKIAVWIPVTDETLADAPRVRDLINQRLTFMLQQRLDAQILTGNGTPPNLEGILNVTGIQTQAKGADPVPDAVYKAMTKVRHTAYAEPDAAVFHPNDWQDVRLLRTADGIYIWGNPAEAGPERIWGKQVVVTAAETENTAVVGDFGNYSELAVRSGIDVQISNSHSDYFVKNLQAIRAEMRVAFIVYRPAAFCTVTGI